MSVQNFSFLARLEVAEKFVVGWWWWWSRPSLGFSFSQAEQLLSGRKHWRSCEYQIRILIWHQIRILIYFGRWMKSSRRETNNQMSVHRYAFQLGACVSEKAWKLDSLKWTFIVFKFNKEMIFQQWRFTKIFSSGSDKFFKLIFLSLFRMVGMMVNFA